MSGHGPGRRPDLELGYGRAELVGRVRDACLAGWALGLRGPRLLAYLCLVNPTLPGSREARTWNRERRRVAGRLSRRREGVREFTGYLPFE